MVVRITINFDNQTYVNKQRKGNEKRLEVFARPLRGEAAGLSLSLWLAASRHCGQARIAEIASARR
jgi:hypothetical protein